MTKSTLCLRANNVFVRWMCTRCDNYTDKQDVHFETADGRIVCDDCGKREAPDLVPIMLAYRWFGDPFCELARADADSSNAPALWEWVRQQRLAFNEHFGWRLHELKGVAVQAVMEESEPF